MRGDRLVRLGRRRAERLPGGEPGSPGDPVEQALAGLLEAVRGEVRRPARPGSPGEEAAVEAFRRARDARSAGTAVRRRPAGRSLRLPARTAAAAVAGALLLGGAAVAAETGVISIPFGPHPDAASPAATAPGGPSAAPGTGTFPDPDGATAPGPVPLPSGSAPAAGLTPGPLPPGSLGHDRGDREGRDALAGLCRLYQTQTGRLTAAQLDRLTAAAGGARTVPDYCRELLGYLGDTEHERSGRASASAAPDSGPPASADERPSAGLSAPVRR